MRRASVLGALGAAILIAGCGSSDDPEDGADSGDLRAWVVEPPYVPPRAYGGAAVKAALPPVPAAKGKRDAESEGTKASTGLQGGGKQTPSAPAAGPASGAPTDAEIRAELKEAYGNAAGADVDTATIGPDGLATIPATAPPRLRALINAANQVARKPYVYGGGHGRGTPESIWQDSAYDCSGSVSFALASAGYIDGPMASGPMMTWGEEGQGKWVTIYANEGHAFMTVAGLRFDTSGRQKTGTRWQSANARSYSGFVARHPKGL